MLPHSLVTAAYQCLSWGTGPCIGDFQHLRSGRVGTQNCDSEYRSGRSMAYEHKHFAEKGPIPC
jgi:hypothetical protein